MHRDRPWVTGLLAVAFLSGCGVQNRPRQQFAGNLTSTATDCPTMTATLIVQGGKVVFSPGDGTWVLSGDLQAGSVRAEKSRPGVDHKLYQTTLDASIRDAGVTGTYKTPSCNYQVDLKSY